MGQTISGAILWGSTGQAKVVHQLLVGLGITTLCLCDRDQSVQSPLIGVPVWHTENELLSWLATRDPAGVGFVAAIGGCHGASRLAVHDYLVRKGIEPIPLVHPTAWVDTTVALGPGHQVLAMAAVGVGVTLGRQCIVNTSATVDHDCRLGDGVHVMPGATIAGEATIEDMAVIGSNATVLPRLTIGTRATVGAGAVVTRDIPPDTTVAGVPARPVAAKAPACSTDFNPWDLPCPA